MDILGIPFDFPNGLTWHQLISFFDARPTCRGVRTPVCQGGSRRLRRGCWNRSFSCPQIGLLGKRPVALPPLGYSVVNASLTPNLRVANHCHDFDAKLLVVGGEITITRQ